MPAAAARALARSAFLTALTEEGLEPDLRAQALHSRAEGQRLAALGARVAAARDELSRLQAQLAATTLADAVLGALGRAARTGDDDLPPIRACRADRQRHAELADELERLRADRSLVARARTKIRRRRLQAELDASQAGEAAADRALGRLLVDEGWLGALRSPEAKAALAPVQSALPPGVEGIGALRAELKVELGLAEWPTALDLRPLLSRTRAEEGAAREAADGAETEAIEAVLSRRDTLSPALQRAADALLTARRAEHEGQRQALEAQLIAIEDAEPE